MKTFYWYFKPIALVCKVLGIFPLQNILSSNDPKDLRAKTLSLAHLYRFTIFACIVYMIYYFSGFIFSEDSSYYLIVVVLAMVGRSFVCFLFCGSLSKKLPKLILLLDYFDRKQTNLLIDKTTNNLRFFLTWTVFPIIIGLLAFSISFYESAQVVLETIAPEIGHIKVAAYFFGALSIWQVIPLLLYIYFALKIVSNFNLINKTIIQKGYNGCFFTENVKYPEDMHSSLEYLRHMHNMMTKTVHELGEFYGNFMAIDQLCIILMVIANICTFINQKQHDFHLLALTFFNIFIILVVLVISHNVREAGTKVVDLLHGVIFSKVSDKCREEIQTFMLQITCWPPEVKASGFFIIDKTQIPSVLSSIATYLVVILQFLDEAKLEDMVSRNCTV